MRVIARKGLACGLVFEIELRTSAAGDLSAYWEWYKRVGAFMVANEVKLVGYDTRLNQFYPVGCEPAYGIDLELIATNHVHAHLGVGFVEELTRHVPTPLKVIGGNPPYDALGRGWYTDAAEDADDPERLTNAERLGLWTNEWNQRAILQLECDTYYTNRSLFPNSSDDRLLEDIYDFLSGVSATSASGWGTVIAQTGWVAAAVSREGAGLFIAADRHRALFEHMRQWVVENTSSTVEYVQGSAEPMARRFFKW